MGRITSALSASQKYCEARMRYIPMKALRETYHAIQILRTVGLSKLPEEHVPSTKEPSLPHLHPLTSRFLSSHIPEFREIVRHPNLKKASALIPQLQEDDREGSHVTVFSPGLAMLQLSLYKSQTTEQPTRSGKMEVRTSHAHFLFSVAVCLPLSTAESGPCVGTAGPI